MKVITAQGWNKTEFYYNWHSGSFEMADRVDLSANDHYNAEYASIATAKFAAITEGLQKVKEEDIDINYIK